jgi:ankyrin repeat protein
MAAMLLDMIAVDDDHDDAAVVFNQADSRGRTLLYWAADHGHCHSLRLLLEAGGGQSCGVVDVNQPDNNGATPLWRAARNGHANCVKLLLEADQAVDVNKADNRGQTPLFKAALFGRADCLKLLLDSDGADVSKTTPPTTTGTPLYCAGELLVEADQVVDVNKASLHGETPVSLAAFRGHSNCVRLLLDADQAVDVNKADNLGRTPLHWAKLRHPVCARLLREAGAK